jgi:hypothetical protein
VTGPIRCPAADDIRAAIPTLHVRGLFDLTGLLGDVDAYLPDYLDGLSTFWDSIRLDVQAAAQFTGGAQEAAFADIDARLAACERAIAGVFGGCVDVSSAADDSHGDAVIALFTLLGGTATDPHADTIQDLAHSAFEAGRLALTAALGAV